MTKQRLAAFAAVLVLAATSAGARTLTPPPGPSLVAVTARTPAQVALLGRFDMAETHVGDSYDVVVWPGDADRLRSLGLDFRIEVPDLDALDRSNGVAAWEGPTSVASARTTYRRLSDYETELAALATTYPDHVKLITAPNPTLEGRSVYGVEIAANVNTRDGRPTSFVMGLHHAREWPAAEMTMDFASYLAAGYPGNARIKTLLDNARVLVVPVVNPDGFNISREFPIDDPGGFSGAVLGGQGQYWRKNRRGVLSASGVTVGSYGVDPNRNYAYEWGGGTLTSSYPASTNPTDQTYQGPAPFSEPETQNVRALVLSNNVVTLLTNHTFAGLTLWPWGHTAAHAPDYAALSALGTSMASADGTHPEQSIGLYATTGTTEDWAYAATGAFGYTTEIGTSSFHPAYSQVASLFPGYREAFMRLVEAARTAAYHSILTGSVHDSVGSPLDATLRLTKTVETPLYLDGNGAAPVTQHSYSDTIDISMRTGASGAFTWHVNPSTRPIATATESYTLTVTASGHSPVSMPVTVPRGQTLSLGTITLG